MVVLPLGLASAQNYAAVAKRLKQSVGKGEITPKQADAMMAALKKETPKSKSDTNLDATWRKLQAMVKKGELTKEQAQAKMSAVKTEAAKKGSKKKMATGGSRTRAKKDRVANLKPDEAREHLMKVKKELGAAVEAGKISMEDAAKKFEGAKKAIKKKMAAGHRQHGGEYGSKRITRKDYTQTVAELKKAVTAGKISREDARKMIEGAIGKKLKAAVKAGKLTEKEAKAKWEAMNKRK